MTDAFNDATRPAYDHYTEKKKRLASINATKQAKRIVCILINIFLRLLLWLSFSSTSSAAFIRSGLVVPEPCPLARLSKYPMCVEVAIQLSYHCSPHRLDRIPWFTTTRANCHSASAHFHPVVKTHLSRTDWYGTPLASLAEHKQKNVLWW